MSEDTCRMRGKATMFMAKEFKHIHFISFHFISLHSISFHLSHFSERNFKIPMKAFRVASSQELSSLFQNKVTRDSCGNEHVTEIEEKKNFPTLNVF